MISGPRLPWEGATELADDSMVYRAVLYRRWIRDGIEPGAFVRRSSDTDGLSVNNPVAYSPEQLCATFNKCYGVLALTIGQVRSLGLGVRPDTQPDPTVPCDHANIVGLPHYEAEDATEAEFLGSLLANLATLVWLDGYIQGHKE